MARAPRAPLSNDFQAVFAHGLAHDAGQDRVERIGQSPRGKGGEFAFETRHDDPASGIEPLKYSIASGFHGDGAGDLFQLKRNGIAQARLL